MSNRPTIIRVAVPVPLNQLFDYLSLDSSQKIEPGMRVVVPFGARKLVGVVWEIEKVSTIAPAKLKAIEAVLDAPPLLNKKWQKLALWLSDYYHYPLGEVCAAMLPKALRQTKNHLPHITPVKAKPAIEASLLTLNAEQELAVEAIEEAFHHFQPFLLEGVTGSGKTEVYLRAIASALNRSQQALVLVPEISLTPQTYKRFAERFPGRCAQWHSSVSEKKKFEIWHQVKTGEVEVIIGTRSAIFLPFEKLGIIIVDEEHDLSFKQQDSLRYSARDVAVAMAKFESIPIVLASATPSLETIKNAHEERYHYLRLSKRAGEASMPSFQLIDLRQQYLEEGLSPALLEKVRAHLAKKKQVLLFLNRRGFAPILLCRQCGWSARCQRCDIPFTFHQSQQRLICHHCEKQLKKPTQCPGCGHHDLFPIGMGTERVEEVLRKHFPDTRILRVDRDTTRKKNQLSDLLNEVHEGEPLILIGTQMLAKGHHFPHVTLVGMINADYSFFSSDFRALERMGQLITQVAGRAGRGADRGEVVIQTHQPEHPLLRLLLKKGYVEFARALLKEREHYRLPPFTHFALLRASGHHLETLHDSLDALKKNCPSKEVSLLGPVAAPMPKKAGLHQVQMLLLSHTRKALHDTAKTVYTYLAEKKLSKVKWSLDIDPQEMF